jgi:hypothetical protein
VQIFPGEGGGRDFVLSFLPSSLPPSAAISHPPPPPLSPFFFFFLSLFPLSSIVVVQPPLVHPTLPSWSPLASFHPLQSCRSQFYAGTQLQFSQSQIYRPSFLHSSDAHHQGLPHRPNYLSLSSPPCSSHHAPPCGSHTPMSASHTRPCTPRAAARSSYVNLLPPCPLLQPLLSGPFYCSFYFPCLVIFLYFCTFSFILLFDLLFVGFYLPAMMWFDLDEEIDVGGLPSMVPFWFSTMPAVRQLFNSGCCFASNGLLMDSLCYLHCLALPWNKARLTYDSFGICGNYHCLLFGSFGPDPEYVLVFALFFTI